MPPFALPSIPAAIAQLLSLFGITLGGAPGAVLSSEPVAPVAYQAAAEDQTRNIAGGIEWSINAHRESIGLAPLVIDGDLANRSVSWSEHQAATGVVDHEPVPGFEVVQSMPYSQAPNADQLVNMWLGSPAHREVIENPEITRMGAGTAGNATMLYATAKFAF